LHNLQSYYNVYLVGQIKNDLIYMVLNILKIKYLKIVNTAAKDYLDMWGDALVADLRKILDKLYSLYNQPKAQRELSKCASQLDIQMRENRKSFRRQVGCLQFSNS